MIPLEALTRHVAILGSTGSGKTTAAKSGIVEPILAAQGRVLVIDPTAAWWGLRLAANGNGTGFPIYIFGGDHGDYPLRAKDASALAEAFGTSSDSAIFDTSLMTVNDRSAFFTDFALALLRRNRGPVNLVIDECHLFMPQVGARAGGMVPTMLHAGNNLVSLGRSKGIRVTMITQRPAKLHKDSLTQAQSLVAMLVLHQLDRKAITDWIDEQGDPQKGKELVASLSSLKAGEAWVWAPLQDLLERVKFPLPKTFDSSRAPDEKSGSGPVLAPINLDALKSRLSTIEAETKANDPKTLKAEIASLRKQINTIPPNVTAPDPKAVEEAERRGFEWGWNARLKEFVRAAGRMREHESEVSKIALLLNELSATMTTDYIAVVDSSTAAVPKPTPSAVPKSASYAKPIPQTKVHQGTSMYTAYNAAGPADLNSAARKMLAVLDTNPPVRRSWTQVATLSGLRARGGHFNTGRKALIDNGIVTESGDLVQIACPSADSAPAVTDKAALVEMWAGNLSGAAPRILRLLFEVGPATKNDIAHSLGMQPRGGHWNTSWKELRDNDIVDLSGETASLTELFR